MGYLTFAKQRRAKREAALAAKEAVETPVAVDPVTVPVSAETPEQPAPAKPVRGKRVARKSPDADGDGSALTPEALVADPDDQDED